VAGTQSGNVRGIIGKMFADKYSRATRRSGVPISR
jgi:hypothetical protein